MTNKIIAIQSFDSGTADGGCVVELVAQRLQGIDRDNGEYEGFRILCEEEVIFLGVSNSSSCCENWGREACLDRGDGVVTSMDNFDEFIGAEVLSVERVSQFLNVTEVPGGSDLDNGGAMFVNVQTDRGLLQFTVYNAHNGYYGHGAVFISRHGREEETL